MITFIKLNMNVTLINSFYMKVILRFSDTQINDDEYVRYKEAEYYKIHFEEMPKYLKEEARNEVWFVIIISMKLVTFFCL